MPLLSNESYRLAFIMQEWLCEMQLQLTKWLRECLISSLFVQRDESNYVI